jgi:carbamoylphosphate synthase large subunit
VVNYNPETTPTDYDECDGLYFDELTGKRIWDMYEKKNSEGVVVSVGGQISNGLAIPLGKAGVKILGMPAKMIDDAEDRMKFSDMIDEIGVQQPHWRDARTKPDEYLSYVADGEWELVWNQGKHFRLKELRHFIEISLSIATAIPRSLERSVEYYDLNDASL